MTSSPAGVFGFSNLNFHTIVLAGDLSSRSQADLRYTEPTYNCATPLNSTAMGQRHQVFLIARVRPKHAEPAYRCVAALHHQWCFGTIPLRAMYRFLRLVTQPENAAIIRTELRELDGKYGRTRQGDSPMPPAPCPYSVSLLATAWTTNLDPKIGSPQYDGVTLRHAVLDAKMGCWDGGKSCSHRCECCRSLTALLTCVDNNDGISIIDVTDPLHPAYCFMKGCLPLSAYEYLQEYYDMKGKPTQCPI